MKRLLALALLLCGLPTAIAQLGHPLDPRPNPNVTPPDAYVLNSTHLVDVITQGIGAPLYERMNAGEGWSNIEPCRNQWNFSGSNNFYSTNGWIPQILSHGSLPMWSMTFPPLWATTAAGAAKTSCTSADAAKQSPGPAPFDTYYNSAGVAQSAFASEVCQLVNANPTAAAAPGNTGPAGDRPLADGTAGSTHGDCLEKELTVAIMQQVCHVKNRPASPMLGCDIPKFEGINEWDVNQAWATNGTQSLNALASVESDVQLIIHQYSADAKFAMGSASCGGRQYYGNCDVGTGKLLDAWKVVSLAMPPDMVSIHPYPGTEITFPQAFPEGRVSGDGTGTNGTSGVTAVSINAGGTGYTVGDLLVITGGNAGAKVNVTAVSSGVVTGLSVTLPGDGYSIASAVSTTGGTGTGAKVNITSRNGFTTNGSGGSSQCPAAGGSGDTTAQSSLNRYCPNSVINAVANTRAAMLARAPWLPVGTPLIGTESGPYFDDQVWDTGHNDPLTGVAYTQTLQRSWSMRQAIIVGDSQNPLYGTGCGPIGCGLMLNNWYQFDTSGSGGTNTFTTSGGTPCSPFGGACSVTVPHSVACFGQEYRGAAYGSAADCSRSGQFFTNPVGLRAFGLGHKTAAAWLATVSSFTTHCGDINHVNKGWNEIWSCTVLQNDGTTAQYYWDTGWERQITVATTYPSYMDGQGNTHTITGGTVTFGPEPIKLFGTPTTGGGGSNPQPNPGSLTTGTVAVTSTIVGNVADKFTGFFYSKLWLTYGPNTASSVCFFCTTNTRAGGVFRNLGPTVLRIGTVESIVWTPAGAGSTANQLATLDIDKFAAWAIANNVYVIYGLNYTTPTNDVAEATYVASKLGSNLIGWEIGNEPDALGGGTTPSNFATGWQTIQASIKAAVPAVPFTGPAVGVATNATTWTTPFMATNTANVNTITQHFYIDNGTVGTTTELLENQLSNGFYTGMVGQLNTLRATYTQPWRLAETNNFYSGGAPNFSNAYGAALFAVDFMFTAAQSGFAGINFSSGMTGSNGSLPYTPISDTLGTCFGGTPEYYGIYLFNLATGNHAGQMYSSTLTASGVSLANAYTVQTGSGQFSTVIVNKDATHNLALTLTMPAGITSATIYALTDTTGILDKTLTNMVVQGSPLDQTLKDGTLTPGPAYTVGVTAGSVLVYAPALSAIVVKSVLPFTPPPGLSVWGVHPNTITHLRLSSN